MPAVIGGKYRVVRQLGQGGMGAVYEALDERGGRVAVKVIMTELANNATLVGRFEREAMAASAIDTPHIAKALDTGTDAQSGLPYLVMELLDGEDIDQLQKRLGPLPNDLALRIGAQACVALQKAHESRVLHRDIKPANLFLAKQDGGRLVKLLDFGVAKVRPEVSRSTAETAGLTRTGSMLGSPLYMSPEQARGYKDIDFRSDLWSLGVVLYKMLAGRTPHADTEELGELIVLICTEQPEPIQDIAPWVPPEVAAVVHRALRFSPAERYASAAEMQAAIMGLLPAGYGITEPMVRAMAESEKVAAAPRLMVDLSDAPAPRRGGQTGHSSHSSSQGAGAAAPAPMASQAQPFGSQAPISTLSGGAVGSTFAPGSSMPGSQTMATEPRRAVLPWIAMAGFAMLLGAGFAVVRYANVLAPGDTAGGAATQAAAAPETKPRSVTVVILPSNARVEVDGTAAPLSEGLLEITGTIGSVHKVRVMAGGAEKNVRVVVAENGAVPPKIEVEGAATEPAHTATAGPLVGPKPKPKPTTTPAVDPLRNKR